MALSKASTDPEYKSPEIEEVIESTEETVNDDIEPAGDETESNEATDEVDSIKPPDITSEFEPVIFELIKKLPLLSASDYMGGGIPKVGALTRVAGFKVSQVQRDEVVKLSKILKRD